MDRRSFVKTAALVPLATGCASFSLASPVESKQENATAHGATSAPMHDRYELTLRRVLTGDSPAYTEEFLLADVRPTAERRFTEFSGDLSGRYIGALATASQVYGTKFPSLDGLVQKVIACQKPDGYFGRSFHYEKPTDDDLALLWGNGRLLVGLVEYYRVKPSTQVLAASRKLGDWLVRIGPLMLSKEIRDAFGAQHFASSYICWMQQTEGLAGLYVITKDERYRKLAEEIAAVIERRPSDHVHGYLTSLRGVMELYSAAGDAQFLRQCESAWQEVAGSKDLLITGGVPEGWSPMGIAPKDVPRPIGFASISRSGKQQGTRNISRWQSAQSSTNWRSTNMPAAILGIVCTPTPDCRRQEPCEPGGAVRCMGCGVSPT